MIPDWLKIIRHHQRRHRLALTFPFLIGALRQPIGARFKNEEEAHAALIKLLADFRDEAPESDTVRIYTCPDLGQPVASVTSTHYYPTYAKWGLSPPEPNPLDIDPPYRPEVPRDVRAAARLLWPAVSSPVVQAKFSYSRAMKSYQPFDKADLQFIDEALAYDEDNEL